MLRNVNLEEIATYSELMYGGGEYSRPSHIRTPINRRPGLSEDKIVYCIGNDRHIKKINYVIVRARSMKSRILAS